MTRTPEGGVRPTLARPRGPIVVPPGAAGVAAWSRRSARAWLLGASAAAAAATAVVVATVVQGGVPAGAGPVAAFAAALACVWSAGAVHGRRAILAGFAPGMILFAASEGGARALGAVVLLGAQAWNLAALAGADPDDGRAGRPRRWR